MLPAPHVCCLSLLHGRHRGAARALPPARRTKVAYSRKPLLSVEYRSDRVAWRCDVRDSLLGVEDWAYGVKRVRFFCILINFVCFFFWGDIILHLGRLHMRELGQTSVFYFLGQPCHLKTPYSRDYIRILIPRGLLVMDCLFLLLFSFLNPQIPGGLKPLQPPL